MRLEAGWISGLDLRNASSGSFNELLLRIGEQLRTADWKTVAASFTLRFGWASEVAIASCLKFNCVPDVSLENVSFKFSASAVFERVALRELSGVSSTDRHALLRELRRVLVEQATPVVEALYEWSGFSRRGSWGQITSSWASHFTALADDPRDQRVMLPLFQDFFAGDDVVAVMQPRMYPVSYHGVTHLYQRRASCCRYYLLPQGTLCASCPLVSPDERLARNTEWMKKQLA